MTYDVIGFWWGPGPPPAWWPKIGSKAEVAEIVERCPTCGGPVYDPHTVDREMTEETPHQWCLDRFHAPMCFE